MQNAAEVIPRSMPRTVPAPRPIRALPAEALEPDPAAAVIRRLAADRLRDLVDDGVTLAYMARMYDVSPEQMERLKSDLIPTRR